MTTITIVIADSIDFCLDALEGFIRENPSQYRLLYTACHTQELIQETGRYQPNLVVTGADMPGISSGELCVRLLQQCATVRIIGRTINDMAYHARQMLRAGARGILSKNACKAELMQCLNWVHQGNFHLAKECIHLQSRKFREEQELNEFEQKVLLHICSRKTTNAITAKIYASPSKVRRARERINRLAGTSNPYGIFQWAYHEGYISLGEVWG